MWESPIEAIYKGLQMQYEDAVINAVQKYDIKINKEELVKALEYDRKQYEKGEWDMFCLITSVWYGKECYFLESNGTVYSRESCTYFKSKEEAYKEFLDSIEMDGE